MRGVINARTGLSAKRSTRSIICRSSVSSAPVSAPSATTALTSSSVTDCSLGRLAPNKRSTRPEDRDITQTTGALARASQDNGRDTATAMRSGFRSATCLGTSSPKMRLA